MERRTSKAGAVISGATGIIIVGLSLGAFWLNHENKNINDVKQEVDKKVEKAADIISQDSESDEKKEDLQTFLDREECFCDYARDKYSNWESSGYQVPPTMEYDSENVSGRFGVYGVPNADQQFRDEVGLTLLEMEEKLKDSAPDYAFCHNVSETWQTGNEDDGSDELNPSVFMKDRIRKASEELCCCSNGMTHFTVDKVEFLKAVPKLDKSRIIWDELYDVVDEKTGQFTKQLPDSIRYMQVTLTVKCNSPWVVTVPIAPDMVYLKDSGEYYEVDKSVPGDDEYAVSIGHDGMAVYSEATTVEYDAAMGGNLTSMYYPMKEGVVKQFRIGYLVDSEYNDRLYLKLPAGGLMKYGDLYRYCVKMCE